MSTDYHVERRIRAADVLDGRLIAFGVGEHLGEGTTEKSKCLTDGRNYVWLYIDDDGFVCSLSRYGANAPSKILEAIATTFDTEIFSEYEPQFWGLPPRKSGMRQWNRCVKKPMIVFMRS
jgi:hypothetical protein